jgi:hypothetical protein
MSWVGVEGVEEGGRAHALGLRAREGAKSAAGVEGGGSGSLSV